MSNLRYDEAMHLRDADKEKIEGLVIQLGTSEAEIGQLRRRLNQIEDEVGRLKKENVRLQGELHKARIVRRKQHPFTWKILKKKKN